MSDEKREMNLFEFIRLCIFSVAKAFKWIVKVLVFSFRLAVQYFWIVLVCTILGFGMSYFMSLTRNVKFKAESTIRFSPELRSEVINALQLYETCLISTNPIVPVQGLSANTAAAFKRMKFFNIIDCKADSIPDFVDYNNSGKYYADTFNVIMQDRLVLQIKSKGNNDFSEYQKSIKDFLQTQPSIVSANAQRLVNESRDLALLNKEVARLDSFSTYDYLVKPTALNLQFSNTMLLSERKQEIYFPYLFAASKLHAAKASQVSATPDIINFQTDFIITCFPSLYMWIIGIYVGFIIGLLCALCVKYRTNLIQFLKER